MQFDADHIFALAGYAEADSDIMANHIRNGVPAIAEREYLEFLIRKARHERHTQNRCGRPVRLSDSD